MPGRYRQILAQKEVFQIGLPHGISDEEYQRLHDVADVFAQKCAELASYAVPETIQHGDLHDGNIFYNDGSYVFYDWGDCSISHPFFSLRTAYVSIENRFNLAEGALEFQPLTQAYVRAWREFETEERLTAAAGLAEELRAIGSLLSWYEVVERLEGEEQTKYAHAIPSLAQEFLANLKV
jgi:aminoglycoside phosphotransferase (APT) family kinase protein